MLSEQVRLVVDRTTKTRLRFIASTAFTMFTVSVDGALTSVIETDGTLTQPLPLASFEMNVAQRVSVLVDWSSVPANINAVYIRVNASISMYPIPIDAPAPYEIDITSPLYIPNAQPLNPNITAVVQFTSGATTVAPNYVGVLESASTAITDSNQINVLPIDVNYAPAATHFFYSEIEFYADDSGVNRAHFNNISSMPMGYPLLYKYELGVDVPTAASFDYSTADFATQSGNLVGIFDYSHLTPIKYNSLAQYYLPYGAVIEEFIFNSDTGDHPIHKHSHPFWLVATSEDPDAATRNRANYPRRDTVTVLAG
jgi:FtsP/CotA-like multicopper oxidase with cupredoxin domain